MGSVQVNSLWWRRGHLLVSKLFFPPHWKRKRLPVEAEIFRRTKRTRGGWVSPGEGASVSALVPGLAGGAPCRRSEQRGTLESKQGFFAPRRARE